MAFSVAFTPFIIPSLVAFVASLNLSLVASPAPLIDSPALLALKINLFIKTSVHLV